SNLLQRGFSGSPLSVVFNEQIATQTATIGSNWLITPRVMNDLKVNYSTVDSSGLSTSDDFHGALPLDAPPLPAPFNLGNSYFNFNVLDLGTQTALGIGKSLRIRQKQLNVVDSRSEER